MSVFAKLGQAVGLLMRWLSPSKTTVAVAVPAVPSLDEPSAAMIVEARAGVAAPSGADVLMRADPERFLLAARLASVAKLNTPSGRTPFSSHRPKVDHPPVPVSRIGAKKVRIDANRGRRIELPKKQKQWPSNVIPFPRQSAVAASRLAKAA